MISITRSDSLPGIWLQRAQVAGSCLEKQMSDDMKLGLILLFMVFALMVIGPVLAG